MTERANRDLYDARAEIERAERALDEARQLLTSAGLILGHVAEIGEVDSEIRAAAIETIDGIQSWAKKYPLRITRAACVHVWNMSGIGVECIHCGAKTLGRR